MTKVAKLQAGDLLFSEPKKKPWWRRMVIEMPQGGERLGHAAFYAGDNQVIEAQVGQGVLKVPFDQWKKKNKYKAYRVKKVSKKSTQQAVNIAKGLVGKEFSVPMALRSYVAPRGSAEKKDVVNETKQLDSLFCSTVLGGAFPDVQFHKDKHNLDLLPVDIKKSKLVKRVRG